jgi:hypothetical protein
MQADRPSSEHARRAARAYGAAADHYDLAALSFWDRFGAATVAGLPLAAGHTVLDLCCGAGASAIPAARLVGPEGPRSRSGTSRPPSSPTAAASAASGLSSTWLTSPSRLSWFRCAKQFQLLRKA